MTELSRSLLAAAREGLVPDPAAMARVRDRVAAAIAAPAIPTAVTIGEGATHGAATRQAATTTGTVRATWLAAKLGSILLVIGVVAATIVAGRARRAPEAPRFSVAPIEIDDQLAEGELRTSDDPPVAPAAAEVKSVGGAAVVDTSRSSKRTTQSAAAPATKPRAEPASLSREVELIDLAMKSLRIAAPRVALEAIRVFERETHGRGQMAEEAAAIEIEARCRLREDVVERVAEFDRRWPSSAQRERIQTACFSVR